MTGEEMAAVEDLARAFAVAIYRVDPGALDMEDADRTGKRMLCAAAVSLGHVALANILAEEIGIEIAWRE